MAVEEEIARPDTKRPEKAGYNPPPKTPHQPTKHQVPPPSKKKK